MNALALDLGTTTGFAVGAGGLVQTSGSWDFSTKRHEDAGRRFMRFRDVLCVTIATYKVKTIYFEEVRRHVGTSAAHIYGGFLAMLKTVCIEQEVAYESVPVGTIKKFWTGSGNAPKDQDEKNKRNAKLRAKGRKEYTGGTMIGEAEARGFTPADDNEADALAILIYKTQADGIS